MSAYAILSSNVVINMAEWHGVSDWKPEKGKAVLTDGTVGIGWSYDGQTFTPPPVPVPTQAEIIAAAEQQKSAILDSAVQQIVVWQTKLLMGRKLSESESAQLNAWMDYIDAVTAMDTEGLIDVAWPQRP